MASSPRGRATDYESAGVHGGAVEAGLAGLIRHVRGTWPAGAEGLGAVRVGTGYFATVVDFGGMGVAVCTDGIGTKALVAQMTGRYDNYQHLNPNAAHADAVPDEVVPEFALAGTPARCIDTARRMFDSGIDQITIRPYAVDGLPRASMIRAFAEQVMQPMLRGGH